MNTKILLEKLGFSTKEVEVYLTILKLGKATPSQIAKVTRIRRPTVYNLTRSLVSKGVVAEDVADSVLHLVALPPESLRATIDRARADLQKKETLVDDAIEELHLIKSEKIYPVPKLRFVEEHELRDYLFQNSAKWHESVVKNGAVWYGFQDHSFVEHYEDWIDWTVKKFKNNDYLVKLFTNESVIEKKMKGRIPIRDVRFLKNSQFTSTTWVAGDYVVMISSRKSPFYLVEIHDATIAHNMREVFKNMWEMKGAK